MFHKLLILLLGFLPVVVFAGGLNASFSGSRIDGLTRSSTVFEYQAAVDASGNLIDVSGSNLFTYSEQLDNAAWTRTALTSISANIVKSPIDNLLAADGLIGTAVDTQHGVTRATTLTASKYKLVVDAKAGNRLWLYLADSTVANATAYFNLSTGVVGTVGVGVSEYSISKVEAGWYKCSITFMGTAAAHTMQVYSAEADTDNSFSGDTATINTYLVGAQVAQVDSYTPNPVYLKTTDTAKPRLDLTPNGSPPPSYSDLQGPDGNRLQARSFQTSNMSGNGTFAAKADKTVGDNPRGTETASLRGNGILDIVTVNYDADTVSVLLGVGDGTFAAQVTYVTGDGPNDVAIGDLRHNGRLDLVVANFAADTVSVLLGNGDGTFGAKTDYATGAVPYDVAVGDLRGTGVLDIVVTNKNDDDISVLLGVGDGTFGAKTDFATGADPQGLALGSLRNNGILDAIVTNLNDDTVSVLLGDGLGAFGAKTDTVCGGGPRGVVVGSLRGNGVLDVIVVNTDDDTVGVLLGDGLGGLAAVATYATLDMPYGLEVAKLRGTYLDVVAANYGTNKISVLLGNGTGVLAAKVDYTVGSSPADVAIGSFRGTGVLDLAVSNMGSDTVSVLLGTIVPQYYSKAHDDSLNVLDNNHTFTFVFRNTVATNTYFLYHGDWGNSGGYFGPTGGTFAARYNKAGGQIALNTPAIDPTDNRYHIVQIVRNNNIATVYIDGTAGATTDITGYGIDGVNTFSIGTYFPDPATYAYYGQILYTRLDAEALSTDRLAYERQQLLGTALGTGYASPSWSFTRSTTSYATYSNKTMAIVPINVSRIDGSGGGALLEGQTTNTAKYSETPNSWADKTNGSVTKTTSTILPNGSISGLHIVHEDATAATQHYIGETGTGGYPAVPHTVSGYFKPINRDWIKVTNGWYGCFFNIRYGFKGSCTPGLATGTIEASNNGFYRCSVTGLPVGGGSAVNTYIYVAEADGDITFNGLNQDSFYMWGTQIEQSPFPTSYVGPTIAAAVIRTADFMTMDPHIASTNKRVIPERFCSTCAANKLTIEFKAKCEWPTGTTQGADRVYLSISGNTGTASAGRNNLFIDTFTDGRVYGMFGDDASVVHFGYSTIDPFNFSTWHTIKFFLDFTDMSRSEFWYNGTASAGWTAHAGTATFDTTNTQIRLSGDYAGASGLLNCNIKDLVIEPKEY